MVPELDRISNYTGYTSAIGESTPSDLRGQAFEKLLQRSMAEAESPKPTTGQEGQRKQLVEAARQMEIQLVTLMFKTMESTSTEQGLLGDSNSAGMAHFKDLFLGQVAEEVVSKQSLGFADSLLTSYGIK